VNSAVRSYPRPPKRIVNPKAMRDFHKVSHECVHCGNPHVSAAHILGKGRRGDDIEANLVPLCGDGSSGCHGAYDNGHSYIGDFGRKVTPDAVRASVGRYILSEAGCDAAWYLTAKLGTGGSVAFLESLGVDVE
jgi:hypothetical protein